MRWAASSLLLLLASCTSERDWRTVASTTRIEWGGYHGGDISKGARSYDMNEGDYVAISIAPLAFLELPKQVIVVQPPPQSQGH